MTKLYINNVEYPLEDGIILNEKYNEELDSAIVTIPYTNRLGLSPFDFVKLEFDEIGDKYFLVNTWTDTTVSFDPLKYSYNISLISETIKLQKIVCPNLSITQPIGLTPRTIADKLEQYYELFIAPQYPELTLSQELLDLCDVECPENMFSRPTMFEVFNTLLSKVNAVVKITNHSIGYLKLDQYGHEILTNKLYYDNETQNINEYANRLDINVDNGISQQTNFVSIDGITPRASSSPLLTDDNMEIILDKPIYEIDKVYVYYRIGVYYQGESDAILETQMADITSYVVEKNVYDYYLASNSQLVISNRGYKRNALYYEQGDNRIQGLSYKDSTWIPSASSMVSIANIINNVRYVPDGAIGIDTYQESKIRENIAFRVEYKTSDSFRLNLIKQNTYNATLVDNQNEKQVDTINFGKVEQDKLNRLGNKEKIITATYDSVDNITIAQQITDGDATFRVINNRCLFTREDGTGYVTYVYDLIYNDGVVTKVKRGNYEFNVTNNQFTDGNYTYTIIYYTTVPQLSDYIDEYVLAQRELVVYDDYTLFKGYLYKDYIRKNLFYGLNSKKRFTQISGEFIDRDEIDNYSMTFSSVTPNNPAKYSALISHMLVPISDGYISAKPHHATFVFFDDNGDALQNQLILKNVSYYDCGKTNTLVAKMEDNFTAGRQSSTKYNASGNFKGGTLQKEVKYTDDYGEFKSYSISVYSGDSDDFMTKAMDIETTSPIADELPLITAGTFASYIAPYNDRLLSDNKNIYKDNREVFGYVANFNFLDTDEVIVGNFASLTGLIINMVSGIHFVYSTTEKYEKGAVKGLGNPVVMHIDDTNATNWENNHTLFNSIVFSINKDTSSWQSFGVLDSNDNLILGVNRVGSNNIATTIYLHINKENY